MKPDQDNATCQDLGTSHSLENSQEQREFTSSVKSPDPALQPAEENPVEKEKQGRMESRYPQMEPREPRRETEDQRRERMERLALQVASRNPRLISLFY